MPNVFSGGVNLKDIEISDIGNLYIDKATQKAYVKVGTEADVTTVAMFTVSEPPTHLLANYPFIFTIDLMRI